ncbi:unnamed protein product [marine sediment metagenome]|uniref:Uncharacterized protein n=1 Tax=marine sediment metagenome TaxID=412755 RepID=X1Q556_9ZZZZ
MEYQEHYDNMVERNNLCDIAAGNGFRMLHDDFDEDWQRGDEPHGTLTFTDVPPEQAPEPEPSELELRVAEIESKMITSEPGTGEVKITNLVYNPTTKEIHHREPL